MVESKRAGSQPAQAGTASGSIPKIGEASALPSTEETGQNPPPQNKRSSAVKVRTRGGVRTMKMYSITEGELGELAALKTFSTLSFSGASAALGFGLSIAQGFAFSEKIAPVVMATWSTWKTVSFILAGVLVLVGLGFVRRGHSRLAEIKAEMKHND